MYKITTEGNKPFFKVKNYDDAINLVSMLADYGKVEENEYGENFKVIDKHVVPVSVTLTKVDKEVGLDE